MTFAGICLKLIFTKPFEDNTWIFFLISNNFFNVEKRSAHCHLHNSSVIRQKGESHNGCFKKTKHVKFTEKRTFFTLWYAHVWNTCEKTLKRPFWDSSFCLITISYTLIRTRTCAYQWVRNVRFSEKLACFVSLKHQLWDSPFWLLTEELAISSWFIMRNKSHKFLFVDLVCLNK